MKLYPVNKFIVVEQIEEKNSSSVLLPEGFTSKSDVKVYRAVSVPQNVTIPEGCKVVALSNMVSKFTVDGVTYHTVPESAVLGYYAGI